MKLKVTENYLAQVSSAAQKRGIMRLLDTPSTPSQSDSSQAGVKRPAKASQTAVRSATSAGATATLSLHQTLPLPVPLPPAAPRDQGGIGMSLFPQLEEVLQEHASQEQAAALTRAIAEATEQFKATYHAWTAAKCALHCLQHGVGVSVEVLKARYTKDRTKKSDRWSSIIECINTHWNQCLETGNTPDTWRGWPAQPTGRAGALYVLSMQRYNQSACKCFHTAENRALGARGCRHVATLVPLVITRMEQALRRPEEDIEVLAVLNSSQANRDAILQFVRQLTTENCLRSQSNETSKLGRPRQITSSSSLT